MGEDIFPTVKAGQSMFSIIFNFIWTMVVYIMILGIVAVVGFLVGGYFLIEYLNKRIDNKLDK